MLAKKERLKRTQFNRFFASGRRHHHSLFTLVHTPYPAFHGSVVVSKKVALRAAARNLLRRRTYEALRVLAGRQKVTGVYIVILKTAAAGASFESLKEGLEDVLGRIGRTG